MSARRGPTFTAATRVAAVIGDPIAHSRSPAMHNAAFRELGIDAVYVAWRVEAAGVGAAVEAVRSLGLLGLNVTVPHKQAVLPFLDDVSECARACAAVNTIFEKRGRLIGENTDAPGLARDLEGLGISPSGKVGLAVVLGSGGSARAAAFALGRLARRIVIAARRPEAAEAVARDVGAYLRTPIEVVPLDLLSPGQIDGARVLRRAGLVVNATSLGMKGEAFAPLDVAATPAGCGFYDLVYTAARTPFLALAARGGRPTRNGLGMLLQQGAIAFRFFTGREAPFEVMQRAVGMRH